MSNHSSEDFRTVPAHSEEFGNVQKHTESFRSPQNGSEPKLNHTLTVREVARMFEAAGVARTERSVTNWCRANKTGIARLDAHFDQNERRYFITPESVNAAIQEELARAKNNAPADSAAIVDDPGDWGAADPNQMKVLELEIRDLKIASGVKDKYIALLQSERTEFGRERQGYIEQLTRSSRQIGELETKLRQIDTPIRPQIE